MKDFVVLEGLEKQYDQIEKIAVGGMAEIYRARQINLNRPVAIKRIRPELRNNAEIFMRFKREARSSANLLHQNLAHVYDYVEFENEAYIIMEFIDGFDVADIISRSAPLPIDIAIHLAVHSLEGLAYIHSHGLVHRDIKPENIRVNIRGEVKIMDLGIALDLDPSENNLTMPGVLIGSPHYLSPEQIGGKKVDGRADIFAFGICLYEMLTGKKPFFEDSQSTVFTKIQNGIFEKPEKYRADLHPLISRVVTDCLKTNPSHRPQSAKKLSAALLNFLLQNYSASSELRTTQFLMQESFLNGDPKSIEIAEKTSNNDMTYMTGVNTKRNKIMTTLFLLVFVIIIALVFYSKKVAG